MIFLDTNVLPQDGSLRAPHIAALRGVASAVSQQLVIPSIVLEESVAARRRAAVEALTRLRAALREASKFVRLESVYLPPVEECAASWRDELERAFLIEPLPVGAAEAALRREMTRTRPAREGRGSRDAAIWLTVLAAHQRSGTADHFVSANTADFADPQDGLRLHPDLEAELSNAGPTLSYAPSIDVLLDRLASKAALQLSERGLLEDAIVTEALSRALADEVAPQIGLADAAKPVGSTYLIRPPRFIAGSVLEVRGFEITGSMFGFVRMECTAQIEGGFLRLSRVAGTETLVSLVTTARFNLWVELSDPSGELVGCEASLASPPSIDSATPAVRVVSA